MARAANTRSRSNALFIILIIFFLQCSFIFCSVELTASKRHSLFLRSHTRVGQKSCRLLHHFALFIYSSTFTWLPSLSSLTAGWKNGWQKSVREQIENKLPSHFHFSVLMLLLAHFILCQLASSPECSPNKQKKKKRKWSKGKKKKKNKNKCKYQMNILHRWRYTQPRKSERYK
jgi:hypothetical protein